jgi:hypothetical protein
MLVGKKGREREVVSKYEVLRLRAGHALQQLYACKDRTGSISINGAHF